MASQDFLFDIMKTNGIDIPRLRGCRLMSQAIPYTEDEIKEAEKQMTREIYERGCCSIPRWDPYSCMSERSQKTDAIKDHFLDANGDLRWELLHGKSRKNMKFAVKKMKKAVRQELETWSRYAGMDDVLCIRARIGGANWNFYKGFLLENEPWFIEKVDECFDHTYCHIYARIKASQEWGFEWLKYN